MGLASQTQAWSPQLVSRAVGSIKSKSLSAVNWWNAANREFSTSFFLMPCFPLDSLLHGQPTLLGRDCSGNSQGKRSPGTLKKMYDSSGLHGGEAMLIQQCAQLTPLPSRQRNDVVLLQIPATVVCWFRAFCLVLGNFPVSAAINRQAEPRGVPGCTASLFWAEITAQVHEMDFSFHCKIKIEISPCPTSSSISGSQCTLPWQCSTGRWEQAQCVKLKPKKTCYSISDNSQQAIKTKKARQPECNTVLETSRELLLRDFRSWE